MLIGQNHGICTDNFEVLIDHSIQARKLDLVIVNETKTFKIVHFAVQTHHSLSEDIDKYLDLVRELRKLWNM